MEDEIGLNSGNTCSFCILISVRDLTKYVDDISTLTVKCEYILLTPYTVVSEVTNNIKL